MRGVFFFFLRGGGCFLGEIGGEAEAGTAQRVSHGKGTAREQTQTPAGGRGEDQTGKKKQRRSRGEAEEKQKNKMRVTAITEAALRSSRRACRASPRLHVADSGVRLDKIRSGCLFTPWYRDISPPPLPSPNTPSNNLPLRIPPNNPPPPPEYSNYSPAMPIKAPASRAPRASRVPSKRARPPPSASPPPPLSPSPVPEYNTLQAAIAGVFAAAQKTTAGHRKLVINLRSTLDQCLNNTGPVGATIPSGKYKGEKAFANEFCRFLNRALVVKKSEVVGDRCLRFTDLFVRGMLGKGEISPHPPA